MADKPHDNATELDAEGVPTLLDALNEDEGLVPPRDHPVAADEPATTKRGARRHEPLADRVLREEPEPSADELDLIAAEEEAAGEELDALLLEPGSEDIDLVDLEKDSVARAMVADGTALSAEEAAMHVIDLDRDEP